MAVLPFKCRRYLIERSISFDEFDDDSQKAVVLTRFSLPAGRFDAPSTNILILLPSGYPDSPPDMFFAMPWLKLSATNHYPSRADQAFEFRGQRWQQWSRHNNQWRPGIDGIWTMVKRVEAALVSAA